jgi:hypothetical protein
VVHFNRDWSAGDVFPDTVLGELQGMIDGCFSANPATNVTKERLIALNYGASPSGDLLTPPDPVKRTHGGHLWPARERVRPWLPVHPWCQAWTG